MIIYLVIAHGPVHHVWKLISQEILRFFCLPGLFSDLWMLWSRLGSCSTEMTRMHQFLNTVLLSWHNRFIWNVVWEKLRWLLDLLFHDSLYIARYSIAIRLICFYKCISPLSLSSSVCFPFGVLWNPTNSWTQFINLLLVKRSSIAHIPVLWKLWHEDMVGY